MDNFTCDMCGKVLLADESTRYIVKIEAFAAYDPLELTDDDLRRDHTAEMARLLQSLENLDAAEAEAQVYKSFRFDLCPACYRRYIRRPLPDAPPQGPAGSPTQEPS